MLEIKDISIAFGKGKKELKNVVDKVSYSINECEIVGCVGESGSGKSVTSLATMGLLPADAVVTGEIIFDGKNMLDNSEDEWCKIRGKDISMVFQEPLTSLNPTMKIGKQVEEVLLLHTNMTQQQRMEQVMAALESVGLVSADIINKYPHELSGGMRQRVMIAMATITSPKLIIADEPTTALDVTTEKQILDLLSRICKEKSMAMLFITHDLNMARKYCDRIVVMEKGRLVEQGKTEDIFTKPKDEYTKRLMAAVLDRTQVRRRDRKGNSNGDRDTSSN